MVNVSSDDLINIVAFFRFSLFGKLEIPVCYEIKIPSPATSAVIFAVSYVASSTERCRGRRRASCSAGGAAGYAESCAAAQQAGVRQATYVFRVHLLQARTFASPGAQMQQH